ncbi:MAG: polysaccharide biosynthesis/export family protein [Candidatus Acidiferrales bacterium]
MKNGKWALMMVTLLGSAMLSSVTVSTAQESSSARGKKAVPTKFNATTVPTAADWRTEVREVKSDEYVIGEADGLHVDVWKEPELSQNVVVRPDGKISLPLVNEVKVAGMTPSQVQQLLTERLKSYVVSPQVTVTVTEIRSKSVYITGEVVRAGEYPMVSPITVLQLIARAGGVTPYANRKGIFLLRNVDGKAERFPFDYNSVLKGKNTSQDMELRPGDTVVIP